MKYSRFDFGNGILVPVKEHENGGGVVALTAKVAPEVYVGQGCAVGGYATITDNVRICGRCIIYGNLLPGDLSVLIEDDVLIAGAVEIRGAVLIRDQVEIRGNAKITGCAQILHNATISDDVVIEGDVIIRDRAMVQGNTRLISKGRRIEVSGEYFMKNQCHEFDMQRNKSKKRKVSALRPLTFDHVIS